MSTVLKSPGAGKEGEQREKLFSEEMPKWSWGAWVEEHELGENCREGPTEGTAETTGLSGEDESDEPPHSWSEAEVDAGLWTWDPGRCLISWRLLFYSGAQGPVMKGHHPGPHIVPEYAKACIVKEPWRAGAGHWGDQRGLSLRGQEERQGPNRKWA